MLNEDIKIDEVQAWMDGGSITIKCSNSEKKEYSIEIQQHMVLETSPEGKMPGRIYFNNKLVDERSDFEKSILLMLEKTISLAQSSNEISNKVIIQEKINYVRSGQYEKNNKKIESQRLQLIGRKFNWIAIDINGKYGLFSSAGSGVIPMNVIEDYNSHENITEKMILPNDSSKMVWEVFANYGFYVYGWKINDCSYIRESKPNSEIHEKLSYELSKLRSLIKLEVSFEDTKEITID